MNNTHSNRGLSELPFLREQGGGWKQMVIVLDLWRTLARSTYPEPIADLQEILGYRCTEECTACGYTPHGQTKARLCKDFLRACLTTGETDPDAFMEVIASKFGVSIPAGASAKFRQLIYNEKNGLCLYTDVEKELLFLKNQGYRLGLLSNVWPFPVKQLLRDSGLDGLFEHVILSCEEGYAKPSTEIYQITAQKFNVSPSQLLVVGDNVELDIRGPLKAGMFAVHIDRHGDLNEFEPGVQVIGNLHELYSNDVR